MYRITPKSKKDKIEVKVRKWGDTWSVWICSHNVQFFRLDYYPEKKIEAEWLATQLRYALRLITKEQHQKHLEKIREKFSK